MAPSSNTIAEGQGSSPAVRPAAARRRTERSSGGAWLWAPGRGHAVVPMLMAVSWWWW